MYARTLSNAHHIRRFTIRPVATSGWEVQEEEDSFVVRQVRYTDWHRVERARMTFAREAERLADSGWIDHSTNR